MLNLLFIINVNKVESDQNQLRIVCESCSRYDAWTRQSISKRRNVTCPF